MRERIFRLHLLSLLWFFNNFLSYLLLFSLFVFGWGGGESFSPTVFNIENRCDRSMHCIFFIALMWGGGYALQL